MGKGSIFSFLLAENIQEIGDIISEFPVRSKFGKYTLCTDATTPYASASCGNVCCGIFGLAVNVITGSSTDLPGEIAETCESISEVLEYEKQLGGKYLILFQAGDQYYILGDATCSIPIFYNTEGSFLCASNERCIVGIKRYPVDREYGNIRKSGDISQAMPYDITPYRQIKQLIPNHYLDMNRQVSIRFINCRQPQKELSVTEATDSVLPMIENLLDFYLQKYKIYCPITAGRDSRVVLSFLLKSKKDFSCYTIRHPEHHAQAQDIIVPVRLCKK
jgi:asparagine synthetase B (glutamine-hydrolysing)